MLNVLQAHDSKAATQMLNDIFEQFDITNNELLLSILKGIFSKPDIVILSPLQDNQQFILAMLDKRVILTPSSPSLIGTLMENQDDNFFILNSVVLIKVSMQIGQKFEGTVFSG